MCVCVCLCDINGVHPPAATISAFVFCSLSSVMHKTMFVGQITALKNIWEDTLMPVCVCVCMLL